MKYILDTNFLHALFSDSDVHSMTSLRIFAELRLAGHELIIPTLVVAELAVAAVDIKQLITDCQEIGHIETIGTSEILLVGKLELSKRRRLKANDCLLLAASLKYRANLVTFDNALQKAAQALKIKAIKMH